MSGACGGSTDRRWPTVNLWKESKPSTPQATVSMVARVQGNRLNAAAIDTVAARLGVLGVWRAQWERSCHPAPSPTTPAQKQNTPPSGYLHRKECSHLPGQRQTGCTVVIRT